MPEIDFPLTWKTVLPGFFDEVLYELELIDAEKSFEEVKAEHFIDNEKVGVNKSTYSADLRSSIE